MKKKKKSSSYARLPRPDETGTQLLGIELLHTMLPSKNAHKRAGFIPASKAPKEGIPEWFKSTKETLKKSSSVPQDVYRRQWRARRDADADLAATIAGAFRETEEHRETLARAMKIPTYDLEAFKDVEVSAADLEWSFRRAFEVLDSDGSGNLDMDEVVGVLTDQGMDREDAELVVLKGDSNHDGMIQYDEFINIARTTHTTIELARALTRHRVGVDAQEGIAGKRSLLAGKAPPAKFKAGMGGGHHELMRDGLERAVQRGYSKPSRSVSKYGALAAIEDSFNASISLQASTLRSSGGDLPPLKLDTAMLSKKHLKVSNRFYSRPTPKALTGFSSSDKLRRQLQMSRSIVAGLDEKVQKGVMWVNANCAVTSTRARDACHKWGAERVLQWTTKFERLLLVVAFDQWKHYLDYDRNLKRATVYLKYRACVGVMNVLMAFRTRVRRNAWNKWTIKVEDMIRHERKAAAQHIQNIARGRAARRRVANIHKNKAAANLQRAARGRLARRRVRRLRSHMVRADAATRIANAWRTYMARSTLRKSRVDKANRLAATAIQSIIRSHLAKKRVATLDLNRRKQRLATHLQRVQRGREARKQVAQKRIEYEREKRVRTLQATYRGYAARKEVAPRLREHRASVKIQSKVRQRAASKVVDERRQEASAKHIQRIIRGKQARGEVQKKRESNMAVKIQKIHRGRAARQTVAQKREDIANREQRERDATTKMQSAFRGHQVRAAKKKHSEYMEQDAAARHVQRIARGRAGRRRAKMMSEDAEWVYEQDRLKEERDVAAVNIQRHLRGHAGRRATKMIRVEVTEQRRREAIRRHGHIRHAKALRIQALQRGRMARKKLAKDNAYATKMQSMLRGHLARQRVRELRGLEVGGWRGREKKRNKAASDIQRIIRGKRAREEARARAEDMERRRKLQAMVEEAKLRPLREEAERQRRALEREGEERELALMVAEEEYERHRLAEAQRLREARELALMIAEEEYKREFDVLYAKSDEVVLSLEEELAKGRLEAEIARKDAERMLLWQQQEERQQQEELFLMNLEEELYWAVWSERRNWGATKIQSIRRGRAARLEFGVILAERRAEAARKRAEEDAMNFAATKVQSMARAKAARQRVVSLREQRDRAIVEEQSAIRIQRIARGRQARKRVGKKLHEKRSNEAALRIQCAARQKQARGRVEVAKVEYAAREEARRNAETQAAVGLQKAVRGHWGRKRFADKDAVRKQEKQKLEVMKEELEQDLMATRIQTQFRGLKGRKKVEEVRKLRAERQARRDEAEAKAAAKRLEQAKKQADLEALKREREKDEAQRRELEAARARAREEEKRNEEIRKQELEIEKEFAEKESKEDQKAADEKKAKAEETLGKLAGEGDEGEAKEGDGEAKEGDGEAKEGEGETPAEEAPTDAEATPAGDTPAEPPAEEEKKGSPEEWVEYWDDNAQAYYYFNTVTQEARWTKPGADEAGADAEDGYRTAGDATDYDTDNWAGGEDWQSAYCTECEYNYATARCDQCKDQFCSDCWATVHAKGRKQEHTWKPITAPTATTSDVPYCVECEREYATRYCVEDGDPYCDNCWTTRHAVGARAGHTWRIVGSFADTSAGLPKASEWVEYFDESYNVPYYYNNATGETSWEDPR